MMEVIRGHPEFCFIYRPGDGVRVVFHHARFRSLNEAYYYAMSDPKPVEATLNQANVSPQSLRSLAKWVESRGGGEPLTEVVRSLVTALEAGREATVEVRHG